MSQNSQENISARTSKETKGEVSFNEFCDIFKGCVHYIFARLFLSLNDSPCQTGKNVFYFTPKALFVLEKNNF